MGQLLSFSRSATGSSACPPTIDAVKNGEVGMLLASWGACRSEMLMLQAALGSYIKAQLVRLDILEAMQAGETDPCDNGTNDENIRLAREDLQKSCVELASVIDTIDRVDVKLGMLKPF